MVERRIARAAKRRKPREPAPLHCLSENLSTARSKVSMASTAYRTNPNARGENLPEGSLLSEALAVLEALLPYLPSEQDVRSNATVHAGIPSPFHELSLRIRNLITRARNEKAAEMELSVAGPKSRAVNESSTQFSRPQRRRQADGTQLHSRERWMSKRCRCRKLILFGRWCLRCRAEARLRSGGGVEG